MLRTYVWYEIWTDQSGNRDITKVTAVSELRGGIKVAVAKLEESEKNEEIFRRENLQDLVTD